ncbi:diguanylate cyclase (GGDEF) domain-containing protein [Peptoclostridium litorale DSM 5388]|uniref:Diguanylate cyclase n=1 Tax=Peptoclostridium litorale DSM 5388 TaxID=1121324 RepID=A0A069RDZ5_PEPLI|nr:diguanylate cyclase [Peptoclostridium litorale]KDR94968.1 diguanylate cyclase [Peptoclostridium litorale DSM 5388]SIO33676.1 diguanylate cyclase (GGDEF) domain-containing protein [Peptoclostridium litorale DSM 5388]
MNIKANKLYALRIFSICAMVSTLSIMVFLFAIDTLENRDRQRERLEVMERFLRFQSGAESTINESVNLMKGYLAYIQTNPGMSEEDTKRYLDELLSDKKTLIRNIGIMKDTTIIWNYPKAGNEKAIGVDLSEIPGQSEEVLGVKETLEEFFVGPVELVQGGMGFIVRDPVIIGGSYWGQMSIVIDGDRYLEQMDSIADDLGLSIVIFNEDEFPLKPFYGDREILDRGGLELDVEVLNNTLKVAVEPLGGWEETSAKFGMLKASAVIVGLTIGFLLHMVLYTRYQLKYQATRDRLTGLNNRYVLDHHYQAVTKASDSSGELVGIFILDINNFKKINDSYGHKVGDIVLIEFAKLLESVGVKDKRVFRLGGDEFLILVSGNEGLQDLKHVERNIRAKAEFRFKYEDIEIDIIPSLGLASYPTDGYTLDEVMHVADSRMYDEKRLTKQRNKRID